MLVVGQSLECWRRPLLDAVASRQPVPLVARARRQVRSGANALDVNFGGAASPDDIVWAARAVRTEYPDTPLFLDCGDPAALSVAVKATSGPIVANAVPLEARQSVEAHALLEVVARAGAGVVFSPRAAALRGDDDAIVEAAEAVRELVMSAGITGPVYLDCLTYPPVSHPQECKRSLRWVRVLRDADRSGVRALTALGNLGHGTPPERRHLLRCIYVVLSSPTDDEALVTPVEDKELMSLLAVLAGRAGPQTAFEEWAAAAQQSSGRKTPPPGDDGRAAWELLRPW